MMFHTKVTLKKKENKNNEEKGDEENDEKESNDTNPYIDESDISDSK